MSSLEPDQFENKDRDANIDFRQDDDGTNRNYGNFLKKFIYL